MHCDVCPASRRSPNAPVRAGSSLCARPFMSGSATASIIGHASPFSTIHAAAQNTQLYALAGMVMGAPCDLLPTACSPSPAQCCSIRPASTRRSLPRLSERTFPNCMSLRSRLRSVASGCAKRSSLLRNDIGACQMVGSPPPAGPDAPAPLLWGSARSRGAGAPGSSWGRARQG